MGFNMPMNYEVVESFAAPSMDYTVSAFRNMYDPASNSASITLSSDVPTLAALGNKTMGLVGVFLEANDRLFSDRHITPGDVAFLRSFNRKG